MTSILTNTAAMSSLRALDATQRELGRTQGQVASGLRVAQASDGAASWSIATTMRARLAGLTAGRDALSLEGSIVATGTSGLSAVLSDLSALKADVVLAHQAGVPRAAIQSDVSARQQSIASLLESASFNGVYALIPGYSELRTYSDATLQGDPLKDPIEGGPITYDDKGNAYQMGPDLDYGVRDQGGAMLGLLSEGLIETADDVSSTGGAPTVSGTRLTSVLDFTVDGSASLYWQGVGTPVVASDHDLDQMTVGLDRAVSILTGFGAALGAEGSRIAVLQAFDASLSDALTSGVGSLVDADMNVASTRLQALQTQQQLGIQILFIANGDGRLVLKLFGA